MRPTQLGANACRGKSRDHGARTQNRVYHLNLKAVKASTNVVACMIDINVQQEYALFDPRATYFLWHVNLLMN
jgi:hypothetical protein